MTEYIVPQAITTFSAFTGQPFSTAHPSFRGAPSDLGHWEFDWTLPSGYPTFASLGIYGIKIRATLAGHGIVGFTWSLDDPGYGVPGGWPDAGDGAGSQVTLDSHWGDSSLPGSIHVADADGLVTWEHTFPVNATASDPYFGGGNYDGLLGKLEISLHALETGGGGAEDYNHVHGYLTADGTADTDVQIFSFDLILLAAAAIAGDIDTTPATRLYPRDDNRGISATNRIHPPPKAGRIIGGYP